MPGFVQSPQSSLASLQDWTISDVHTFVSSLYGRVPEPIRPYAALRADGRFRNRLFDAARAGLEVDQRHIVETSHVALAVVNGAEDPLVKLDDFDSLAYTNYRRSRCHRLPGLSHAPFSQAPDMFAPLLQRFVLDSTSEAP